MTTPCACANFDVCNNQDIGAQPYSFTYIDCDGVTQSVTLGINQCGSYCGCVSSFDSDSPYLLMSPKKYDICPLGTIGFDDRIVTIYGNYTITSLYQTPSYTNFTYINYNGDTITQDLLNGETVNLVGVKVGSLESASLTWDVIYTGEYVP